MKVDGFFPDGAGLYLQVTNGAKSWIHRFTIASKTRYMGLGAYPDVSLSMAREAAAEGRRKLAQGIDPIEARSAQRAAVALTAKQATPFRECVETYIAERQATWDEKNLSMWQQTMRQYVYPAIGELPVAKVDDEAVLSVLRPIWPTITETADRVRWRIETVLDWAKVGKYRDGENPARWRGHLKLILTKRPPKKHHPAMPYRGVPAFFASIPDSPVGQALKATILTAKRTSEVVAAKVGEFDLPAGVWTIPGSRMKARREHREPITPALATVVGALPQTGWAFLSEVPGKHVSDASMLKMLQRTHPGLTVHGFRSSFRDWAAEETNFPRDLAEVALAHTVTTATEAAYQRGDLFEKRRQLMQAWAKYVTGATQ
jgi:integrase